MLSYVQLENLALLYNKNTLHRIELATRELLKQIKFTANKTRSCLQNWSIQEISKENAKKNSIYTFSV